MDIQTIITNLERTIKGKTEYLSHITGVKAEILQINIDELQRILDDLKSVK
jgi:hypothetical protein